MNSVKQFAESPDFDEAVVDAVADNQGAHNGSPTTSGPMPPVARL
ncbi:MAG: hypothetical protein V9F04_14520 [Dermatophilaceae bacterium]